jgi:hypothetical protein
MSQTNAPGRGEFISQVRAQAFTDHEGRRIIHCLGSFTGADWDEGDVIGEIERARDVKWVNSGLDHDLAVLTADERIWRFGVTRLGASTN